MITRRFGRFQPFVDINSREDNRYGGVQVGFVSYSTPESSDVEEYQQTYFEIGSRCDHLADPIMDLFNVDHEPQTASTASATDARRLRKLKDEAKSETQSTPVEVAA